MKKSLFEKLLNLQKRHIQIEQMLSCNNIINNQKKFLALSKEYSELNDVKNIFVEWQKIQKKIDDIKVFLNDVEIKELVQEEINLFNECSKKLEKQIENIFLSKNKNKNDKRNCYIEIHAGTGGNEAAIFAGDLFRMYYRYSELNKWHIEIINTSNGEKGGYKEILIKIIGKYAYGKLKFESGGHRVQRVPSTESQGRLHTSTCTVAVLPELLNEEIPKINPSDLKIDTFRSSGAGGQHVNTTDSAIRITHIPTGTTVACQDERSQHKNKAKALSILGSRIRNIEITNREIKKAKTKKNLLGTGLRSDRNRTYNFVQGRITDHRINLSIYKLDEIMSGKLDLLINEIIKKHNLIKIKELYSAED